MGSYQSSVLNGDFYYSCIICTLKNAWSWCPCDKGCFWWHSGSQFQTAIICIDIYKCTYTYVYVDIFIYIMPVQNIKMLTRLCKHTYHRSWADHSDSAAADQLILPQKLMGLVFSLVCDHTEFQPHCPNQQIALVFLCHV